ncbi:hypothetical protein WMY93_020083 [Mugilogobius chulae]|uniref:CAP N-terminal domain-containing protein n=1 Tax=Mugilogobius chulae TaxID=88201 RepID=A0AAW0NRC8_9GOBI
MSKSLHDPVRELDTGVMAELASLVARLEVAVGRLEGMSGLQEEERLLHRPDVTVSKFVEAYDDIVSGAVAQYLSLSQKIGGDVQKHADMMKQGFAAVRQIILLASTHQKPSDSALPSVMQPVSKLVTQVMNFREANRTSALFNHLSR